MAFVIELGEDVTVGKDAEGTPVKKFNSLGFYNLRKINSAGHPDGPNIVGSAKEAYKFQTREQANIVIVGDDFLRSSRVVEVGGD